MGRIVRWRERDRDPAATTFEWDVFLQAGEPTHTDPLKRGNVKGMAPFAQPDGCYIDPRGVLWISIPVKHLWRTRGETIRLVPRPSVPGQTAMLAAGRDRQRLRSGARMAGLSEPRGFR